MNKNFSNLLAPALLLVVVACTPEQTAAPIPAAQGSSAQGEPTRAWQSGTQSSEQILFQVIRADGSSQPFILEDIIKLPPQQITLNEQMQEGRRLLDILAAAGVTDFSEVVVGNDKKSLTFPRAQTDDLFLVLNVRGGLALAGNNISRDDAIWYVKTITVR